MSGNGKLSGKCNGKIENFNIANFMFEATAGFI